MLMKHRQREFEEGPPCFYFLSSDSSLQRGSDFQMSLEDRISMDGAATLYQQEFSPGAFSASQPLRTTALPAALIGAGNSALTGKFESFIDAIKLDIGLGNLKSYSARVVGFVADYGTEAKFMEVPLSFNVLLKIICHFVTL